MSSARTELMSGNSAGTFRGVFCFQKKGGTTKIIKALRPFAQCFLYCAHKDEEFFCGKTFPYKQYLNKQKGGGYGWIYNVS